MRLFYAFAIALALAGVARAGDSYPERAASKLAYGLATLITAPAEPFIGAYRMGAQFDRWEAPDPIGVALGVISGAGVGVAHALTGAWDILTFPIAPRDMRRRVRWTLYEE